MTEREYDDDGRLVRTVTTWEPRWLEEDMAWAKAYLRWKVGQCPGCRLQLSETTAMQDGAPVHQYTVADPFRCYACDARIKAQDEHAKKGSVREQALLWQIEQV
ncbi:hypothetical protein ACFQVD_26450 [Streptosporangium amethystogenes subsp. fukuiense]|uniref:Uncharacterized protein n=1 Tax=Streptosporangium amethystogenes subsp. fukuiense TaxID=698418 RepID=A0ABW2T5L0_9ACTN